MWEAIGLAPECGAVYVMQKELHLIATYLLSECQLMRNSLLTMPSTQLNTAAAERKRLRDRVSQQNLRNKRYRRVQDLERQVQLCHETHGPSDSESLLQTIEELRKENAILRQQHERLKSLFHACQEVLGSSGLQEGDKHAPPDLFLLKRSSQRSNSQRTPQQAFCQGSSSVADVDLNPPSASSPYSHSRQSSSVTAPQEFSLKDYCPISHDPQVQIEALPSTSMLDSRPDLPMGDPDDPVPNPSDLLKVACHPRNHSLLGSWRDSRDKPDKTQQPAQCRLSPLCLDFPYAFEKDLPFLDSGLLKVLDLWAENPIRELPEWARIPLRASSSDDASYSP